MPISTVKADATALVFNPYRTENNRAIYIGPLHTDISKQQLTLSSSAPKQNSSTYGNRRSSLNYVATVNVENPAAETVRRDMKAELSVSVPVGTTFAELEELLAGIADMASDDAFMTSLLMTGQIEY